ncbi:terminase small subunit [Eisenbergiella massiliensis]|uniref:terminase small subunit n=1 Tax=Lachnospiraceae TaxID=186803 RepID=UPI003995D2D5
MGKEKSNIHEWKVRRMTKGQVGRPPKYEHKEEIEGLIEEYFKKCEGEILKDEEGEVIFDKFGNPVIVGARPPTVTGLALALGFSTRLSLLNYQGKKEFMNTITRAKSMVEAYAEERLFDKDGSNGARFSLINNFRGWTEKPQTDLDEQEQEERIQGMRLDNAVKRQQVKMEESSSLGDIIEEAYKERDEQT